MLEEGGYSLVETNCDAVLEDIDTQDEYIRLLGKYGFGEAVGQGEDH